MILVLLVITLLIILICLLEQKREAAPVPPGPPGLPLIGNLHQFGLTTQNRSVYLSQLSKKYGPLMLMNLGRKPFLVINSARLAKEVLKTQELAFCNHPNVMGPQKFAYDGLDIAFSPYGEYWREMKKILSVHHFSTKKIKSYGAIRADEICRLVTKIRGFASSGKVVNMNEMAMAHISTLTCRTASGKRYNEQQGPRLNDLMHESVGVMGAFYISEYFPSLSWVDKLTGSIKLLDVAFKNLDEFYQELIDDHLGPDRVKRQIKENDNILDILIQMKEEQKSSTFDVNSWDNIKALLKAILLGGTDTSAALIVWIMTSLTKTPKVMKKVREEVRELIGKKGKVDEDDLPKLLYLKAVIKETLRLYPTQPVVRETIDRCILDGYEIQPKTIVYVNAWAIARDPDNWENPVEFLPERFLNNDIDINGHDFRVLPFGSGRRVCPGMLLGLANVELTVANLLYFYDWEMPPGIQAEDIDTDTLPSFTMHKKNPLFLVPKKYVI